MTKIYNRRIYSGICKCGHDIQDHHQSIVMNNDYFNQTKESIIPNECERYNFEGYLSEEGECNCNSYQDKDDPNE